MHDFLKQVLHLFSRAVGPAVIIVILAGCVWLTVREKYKWAREMSLRQAVPLLLLFGYLGGVVTITLLTRSSGGDSSIQLHLFRAFREAWNNFTLRSWLNPLLNIGMFLPLGILLPLAARVFRRWYVTLVSGLGLSLVIECAQHLLGWGLADVDDLFCNTLGTMLGYCLCLLVLCLMERKWVKAAACVLLPVGCVAVLIGVFVRYYAQPYGNLADAASFAADTKNVDWVLECALSDEAETGAVYWTEPFTKDSCEAFALAMAEERGADLTGKYFDIDYYDNEAFYTDHSKFGLWVYYNDRTYDYHDYRVEYDDNGTATEEELRDYLAELDIQVPEAAAFSETGDGVYTFTADLIQDGDTIANGTVTCYVSEGGVTLVQNELCIGTYYSEEPLISQQEAYDQLLRGLFSNGDWFEYTAPTQVRILSCDLNYIVDSKGFYQPVWQFALEGKDPVFVAALAG